MAALHSHLARRLAGCVEDVAPCARSHQQLHHQRVAVVAGSVERCLPLVHPINVAPERDGKQQVHLFVQCGRQLHEDDELFIIDGRAIGHGVKPLRWLGALTCSQASVVCLSMYGNQNKVQALNKLAGLTIQGSTKALRGWELVDWRAWGGDNGSGGAAAAAANEVSMRRALRAAIQCVR